MEKFAGIVVIPLLLATPLSLAQTCDGCEWSERGDRSEGVWKDASMISGGSFELMSVRYRASLGSGGSDLKLFFWHLQRSARIFHPPWSPRYLLWAGTLLNLYPR